MLFWVYAIKSLKRDRIYIGQTIDLEKRVQAHNSGLAWIPMRGFD